MKQPELIPVSDEQLQLDLSVLLAVNARRIPMLHGNGAVQGTTERDQARGDFVSWRSLHSSVMAIGSFKSRT